MQGRRTEVLPLAVAALLLAVLAVYYAQFLGAGPLRHYDEYLTLDRSAGFRANGDWATVFGNNQPTFNKPPLQYWISGGLMAAGFSPEFATRLPSFVFGLGVLALSGLLAFCLIPTRPWAMPAAILLVASSLKFWLSALSALLDTGAIFFAYLALIGVLLALKEPRWWYLVASACVLGAMQKIPLGIAFAAAPIAVLAVAERWTGAPVQPILRTKEFRRALIITLIGTLAWPILQTLRHGFAGLRAVL